MLVVGSTGMGPDYRYKSSQERREQLEQGVRRLQAINQWLPVLSYKYPICICVAIAFIGLLFDMIDFYDTASKYIGDDEFHKRFFDFASTYYPLHNLQSQSGNHIDIQKYQDALTNKKLLIEDYLNQPKIFAVWNMPMGEQSCGSFILQFESLSQDNEFSFCIKNIAGWLTFEPGDLVKNSEDEMISFELSRIHLKHPVTYSLGILLMIYCALMIWRGINQMRISHMETPLRESVAGQASDVFIVKNPEITFDLLNSGKDPFKVMHLESIESHRLLTNLDLKQEESNPGKGQIKEPEVPQNPPHTRPRKKVKRKVPKRNKKRGLSFVSGSHSINKSWQQYTRYKTQFLKEATSAEERRVLVPIHNRRAYVAVSVTNKDFDTVYKDYAMRKEAAAALRGAQGGFCRSRGQKGIKRGKDGLFHLKTIGNRAGKVRQLVGRLSKEVMRFGSDDDAITVMQLTLHREKGKQRKLH